MNQKELAELEELKRQRVIKERELETIKSSIYVYESILRQEEIEAEVNFDSWELAKKNIHNNCSLNKEFRDKVFALDKNFWKKCLTEKLSYEEEHLCILQYERISEVNAEMGRSHGKGTFGYRFRDMTKDEFDKMQNIYEQNFKKYLKIIKFIEYEQYEGVSPDGSGGWDFEELEDK